MKFFWFFVFSLIFQSHFLNGQNHYLLEDFKTIKDKQRVILTWTIKKGNTCAGTGILRSVDNIQYEVIGEITGICGNAEFAQSYSFIDEFPVKNKINYYILELGFAGKTSPAIPVEIIDFQDKTSKVIPNPMHSYGKILFNNPNNEKHQLYLYNNYGKLVLTVVTLEDFFLIDWNDLYDENIGIKTTLPDIYYYTITNINNAPVTSGKIVKMAN